ncbi:hypothetical protein H0A70_05225 [Alcaligenaceae bacterium]|nr:hypothetical protein [Alcaligenaceae bacterium]
MRLDRVARFWWRLWSVRFAIGAALVAAAGEVLPLWQPAMGVVPYAAISSALAVLSAVSRVVHQGAVQSKLDAGAEEA